MFYCLCILKMIWIWMIWIWARLKSFMDRTWPPGRHPWTLNAWNFYLFIHLLADAEQHQHVVALCDAHGVEVTEHVGARDPALRHKAGGTSSVAGHTRDTHHGHARPVHVATLRYI